MGAKELRAARARLAATIANEIRAGGGKVAEDNPHVKRVQGEVAEIEEGIEQQLRWWKD